MNTPTYQLSFEGGLLQRGFWLYVWEITTPREIVYYVGRTGDSSSNYAQSPFNRMGQHLGFNEASNTLRSKLREKGVALEASRFRLVAHGPILQEGQTKELHDSRRDSIAALEKALAEAMCAVGYKVLNQVKCRKPLDHEMFAAVLEAFGSRFPKLKKAAGASA